MTKPQQTNCHYCGIHIQGKQITKDHVIPRIKGGKDIYWNYVWACILCNLLKGAMDYNDFVLKIKRFPIAEWAKECISFKSGNPYIVKYQREFAKEIRGKRTHFTVRAAEVKNKKQPIPLQGKIKEGCKIDPDTLFTIKEAKTPSWAMEAYLAF